MTAESDLQDEAGILALACGQIGNELAQGRLAVAADAYRKLGAVMKKLASLETAAAEMGRPKSNGHKAPAAPPEIVTPS